MTADFTPLVDSARRHVDEGTVPACQLAVARDGEVVLFEVGEATTNTRFCIFSATKPIVSAAVWLLIGDGLLDISARVAEYVPEFAANGMERVTVCMHAYPAEIRNGASDPPDDLEGHRHVAHLVRRHRAADQHELARQAARDRSPHIFAAIHP